MVLDDATARHLLEQERQRLEQARSVVGSDLGEELEGADDELTDYDQHPAEMGTELHDRTRDLTLRSDLDAQLEENAAAFRRLAEGRYGICERCGKLIDDERLEAMPSTRFCRDDQLAVAAGL